MERDGEGETGDELEEGFMRGACLNHISVTRVGGREKKLGRE